MRIILAALLGFPVQLFAQSAAPDRPNILWISVEDMSPRLSSYGDSTARTPNLDRLAAEGIRFTRVFSVAGVCAPSRCSLITGMYQTAIGGLHMRTLARTAALDRVTDPEALKIPVYEAVPPPEVKCFSEYLRAAGYYCTNNSKTDYQFQPPITAWDESSNTAHWRNRPEGSPFFTVFNIGTTHESQVWERADQPLGVDPATVPLPPYYPDTPVVRRDMARHYSNIQVMDSEAGEILEQLRQDGLLERTIIFFFSDHGDGLPRAKRWVYDSGLHVPLIVRFPQAAGRGSTNDRLISFVDFAPTVLSLAGLEIPAHLDGRAFLGPRKGPSREYVFAARDRMDPAIDTVRAVRNLRFKYIRNFRPEQPYVQFIPYRDQMPLMQELLLLNSEGRLDEVQKLWFRSSRPQEELYDTEADPHEIHNLAGQQEYSSVLQDLNAKLTEWIEMTGDPLTLPEEELVRRMWPGGVQPTTAQPVIYPGGSEFADSVEIRISCPTEGASIAYRIGDGRWMLYTGPVTMRESGELRATAIRIGYEQSSEVVAEFRRTGS